MEILHKMQNTTILSDLSVPCIILKQVGFLNGEEFRMVLNKSLELMIEMKKVYGKCAGLFNLIEGDAQANEDLEWAGTDWNMRALAAGIQYVAFTRHEDDCTMAQLNADTYAELSESEANEGQMTTRTFKNEESAKAWLREVLCSGWL